MGKYITTPQFITIEEIEKKNFSLSSSQYKKLIIKNLNTLYVKDFFSRQLNKSDLGQEVGSQNYVNQSQKYFLRTKALQDYSFLPEINNETAIPIKPKAFVDMNLTEGDLILSKDSNIGEIIILDKDYPNLMLSGALYKLPIKEEFRYYFLALVKHDIFRDQLNFMVPNGATIRHAKKMFLECKIPIPSDNRHQIIQYVSVLTKAIIEKEKLIRIKHNKIIQLIEEELLQNQKEINYVFEFPSFKELQTTGRLDTNLYNEKFKQINFLINNYRYGHSNIYKLGFGLSRGQNLQFSNIGKSIYSSNLYPGFYTLMLPTHISEYGTVNAKEYLGNSKELKTLQKGDIIFGAEGFKKGRSIVIIEEKEKTITNIHGITIQQQNNNLQKSIFVKSFLDYLRNNGVIDMFAVGGNGGSLAQQYWDIIEFPNFNWDKEKEITNLYHNPDLELHNQSITLDNFTEVNSRYNLAAGIYELEKSSKIIKTKLNEVITKIINDEKIEISFDFLYAC